MSIAFFALVRKDIQIYLHDRKAVAMSVVAPIVIASFFGYIFSSQVAGSAPSRIAVLLVDEDQSRVSHSIGERLNKEKGLATRPVPLAEARETVRKGKAAVALHIRKGFGEQAAQALFRRENLPEIGVYYDPTHQAEAGMVKGVLTGSVMQAVSEESFSGPQSVSNLDRSLKEVETSKEIPSEARTSLATMLKGLRQWNAFNARGGPGAAPAPSLGVPFTMRDEAMTSGPGRNYNAYAHSFVGMAVQFLLFFGIDVGVSLLYLRQRGLWQRLRAAPLSRATLLASRAVSAALISFVILLVVFGFARAVFQVRIEGSVVGFLLLCAAFSLLTATFGLLIAALGNTPEAARGLAILVTLLMVMLGGAWVPTFVFPQSMQDLTRYAPTRWAVDGLDGVIWRGFDLTAALSPALWLLACALLFGALAMWRFRWDAD